MRTGLHVRRATGQTVAEMEESFTRTESVARWSREGREAYEAERDAPMFDFFLSFFLTGVRCSNQAGNYYTRGDRFFLFPKLSVSFSLFLLCCCAVLCILFSTNEYRHKAYFGLRLG